MAIDLWTSSTTKVNNWSGNNQTPDITIERSGSGAHSHVTGQIVSLNQSGGASDTKGIVTFGNKRINQEMPQEDIEWKFDVAFTSTQWDSYFMGTTYAAGTEIKFTDKSRFRIIITWQDPEATSETSAERLRWILKDAIAVSFEPSHSGDEYLKGTITFKAPATDSNGNSNLIKEYRTSGSFTTLGSAHGGAEDSYVYTG